MVRSLLVCLLLLPAPAFAHKLNVYAQVQGTMIVGRVYFSGDAPAKQAEVMVRDPSGRELGRTKTDADGNFTLPARVKVEHRISAETPDGHAASYPLSAAELPDGLAVDTPLSAAQPQAAGKETSPPDPAANPNIESAAVAANLEALQKQVVSLRAQIDQSEQRLRLHDLLGGIGYILGLAGVALYLKARQRGTMPSARDEKPTRCRNT